MTRDPQVWSIDLALERPEVDALAALLSEDERLRASSMRAQHARRRFVVTRAALRQLLGRYVDADPAGLRLETSEHGEPRLAPALARFNVAHSGDLALVALSPAAAVGVDVELMRARRDPLRLAQHYFTANERRAIELAAEPERTTLFYRYWVAKEAFVKATGRGLARSLRSFEVELDPPRIVESEPDGAGGPRWSLAFLDPGEAYAAALVTEGSIPTLSVATFAPTPPGLHWDDLWAPMGPPTAGP